MARPTALPHHTLTYFAAQLYRGFSYRGATKATNKTVQGVELHTEILIKDGVIFVNCTYMVQGMSFNKLIKAAKSWLH